MLKYLSLLEVRCGWEQVKLKLLTRGQAVSYLRRISDRNIFVRYYQIRLILDLKHLKRLKMYPAPK